MENLQIKIKVDYNLMPPYVVHDSFLDIKLLQEYLEEKGDKFNEDEIITFVYDYIYDNIELFTEIEDKELIDDNTFDATIYNDLEIIEYFKYLIKEDSCCEGKFGNFCSTCGKKLSHEEN